MYGLDAPWPVLTTMTSRPPSTGTRSTVGNAGGSIRPSSALTSSMVRSLTCCPTTAPVGVTPNSTCPPFWFRKAHTVMAASRRVPVVALNSSVSDSPVAARTAIWSMLIGYSPYAILL